MKEPSGNNFDKNQSPKTDSFLENFRAEEVLKQKNTDNFLENFKVEEARRQTDEPRDEVGQTALHRAALMGGSLEILTLIDSGASKNVKDDYGKTPWDYAKINEKVIGTTAYYTLKGDDKRAI